MAFGSKGLLGHFITPSIGIGDTLTIAKQHFGNDVTSVVNLDGDFYAKSLLFFDSLETNSPRAERFIGSVLLVQPKATLAHDINKLKVDPISDCEYKGSKANDKINDFKEIIQNHDIDKIKRKLGLTP
jgi:hypothetical protein